MRVPNQFWVGRYVQGTGREELLRVQAVLNEALDGQFVPSPEPHITLAQRSLAPPRHESGTSTIFGRLVQEFLNPVSEDSIDVQAVCYAYFGRRVGRLSVALTILPLKDDDFDRFDAAIRQGRQGHRASLEPHITIGHMPAEHGTTQFLNTIPRVGSDLLTLGPVERRVGNRKTDNYLSAAIQKARDEQRIAAIKQARYPSPPPKRAVVLGSIPEGFLRSISTPRQ